MSSATKTLVSASDSGVATYEYKYGFFKTKTAIFEMCSPINANTEQQKAISNGSPRLDPLKQQPSTASNSRHLHLSRSDESAQNVGSSVDNPQKKKKNFSIFNLFRQSQKSKSQSSPERDLFGMEDI